MISLGAHAARVRSRFAPEPRALPGVNKEKIMRKVTLIFGLLAGAIISVFLIIGMALWENGVMTFDISELIGYGSMVIALTNPVIRFGITLMEILPVGIIITLISAAILRKKEFLPAERLEQDGPQLET